MKTITVVLIFLLVFTVIKLSGIVAISKLMKPSEKQIEEARQKRLQAGMNVTMMVLFNKRILIKQSKKSLEDFPNSFVF